MPNGEIPEGGATGEQQQAATEPMAEGAQVEMTNVEGTTGKKEETEQLSEPCDQEKA